MRAEGQEPRGVGELGVGVADEEGEEAARVGTGKGGRRGRSGRGMAVREVRPVARPAAVVEGTGQRRCEPYAPARMMAAAGRGIGEGLKERERWVGENLEMRWVLG